MTAVAWHPTDPEILCVGVEGLWRWSVETGKRLNTIQIKWLCAVAWFPGGERFACADSTGMVYLFARSVTPECEYRFENGYKSLYGLVAVSDATLLVAGHASSKYKIKALHVGSNQLTLDWEASGQGYGPSLSPLYDDKYIVLASEGIEDVEVWNLEKKAVETRLSRRSKGSCRCIMVGLHYGYVVGVDGSKHHRTA
jgi:hypothetical protein